MCRFSFFPQLNWVMVHVKINKKSHFRRLMVNVAVFLARSPLLVLGLTQRKYVLIPPLLTFTSQSVGMELEEGGVGDFLVLRQACKSSARGFPFNFWPISFP